MAIAMAMAAWVWAASARTEGDRLPIWLCANLQGVTLLNLVPKQIVTAASARAHAAVELLLHRSVNCCQLASLPLCPPVPIALSPCCRYEERRPKWEGGHQNRLEKSEATRRSMFHHLFQPANPVSAGYCALCPEISVLVWSWEKMVSFC